MSAFLTKSKNNVVFLVPVYVYVTTEDVAS